MVKHDKRYFIHFFIVTKKYYKKNIQKCLAISEIDIESIISFLSQFILLRFV